MSSDSSNLLIEFWVEYQFLVDNEVNEENQFVQYQNKGWIDKKKSVQNSALHDALCIPKGFQRSSIRATNFLFDNALDSLYYGTEWWNRITVAAGAAATAIALAVMVTMAKDNGTETAAMTATVTRMERWMYLLLNIGSYFPIFQRLWRIKISCEPPNGNLGTTSAAGIAIFVKFQLGRIPVCVEHKDSFQRMSWGDTAQTHAIELEFTTNIVCIAYYNAVRRSRFWQFCVCYSVLSNNSKCVGVCVCTRLLSCVFNCLCVHTLI